MSGRNGGRYTLTSMALRVGAVFEGSQSAAEGPDAAAAPSAGAEQAAGARGLLLLVPLMLGLNGKVCAPRGWGTLSQVPLLQLRQRGH